MSSEEESLREARARDRIGECYIGGKSTPHSIHTVSFQPRGVDYNEDRVVMDKWDIHGQPWLFLGVFDGHLGPATADYASKALPAAIRKKLLALVGSIGGRLDRDNLAVNDKRLTRILKYEIEQFDAAIGQALKDACPHPSDLRNERGARRFIEAHLEVVQRAFCGTTVALALISLEGRCLWTANVGDSSIGLSYVDADGCVRGERLSELHSFKNRKEFFRVNMEHRYFEQPIVEDDRILGWLQPSRAIGDFSLKLRATYLAYLFRYMAYDDSHPGNASLLPYIPKILTPPYISAEPHVAYLDLDPYWDRGSNLFLFTDGVDNLVDGCFVFTPQKHSDADAVDVVAKLLADELDPRVEEALGHRVLPRWSGLEDNRATDVLGNLLGGQDVERLEMVTDLDRLEDQEGWPFHIDDVSIMVWPVTDL